MDTQIYLHITNKCSMILANSLLSCIIQCYMFIQDLAARNILIDQNELCKVGDFGLLRKTTKDEGQNYSCMMQVRKITVAIAS